MPGPGIKANLDQQVSLTFFLKNSEELEIVY